MWREAPVRAGRRIACLAGGDSSSAGGVARAFSPWVDVSGDGAVWLDVRGCGALHRSEEGLAAAIGEHARRAGAAVRVGIAGSKAAARLAAEHDLGVVPPDRDREALAALPIDALRPSAEAAEAFRRWGIERLGQFAALPRGEVALRLGAEGSRLWEIAAGEDDEPLVPTPQPDEPEEAVDLEYPAYEVEPLLFVLRGAIDRLAGRLAERGTAFGAVVLRLLLESGGADDRALGLASPLRDVPAILALLRVSIEAGPPAAPVVGVRARAIPAAGRPAQLSLFEPAGPSPQKLAVALARLAALVGPDRVGTPARTAAHRSAAPLALRVLRPPVAVQLERKPVPFLRLRTADPNLSGPIVRASGPWRLRSGWWGDSPVERDYYDVELSGGALLRVFRDAIRDEWFIDGVYD
jgi:protein ImuB